MQFEKMSEIMLDNNTYEIMSYQEEKNKGVSICDKKYSFLSESNYRHSPTPKTMITAYAINVIRKSEYHSLISDLISGRGGNSGEGHYIEINKPENTVMFQLHYTPDEDDPDTTLPYLSAIKLFHAYFNAFKVFVEEYAPELKTQKAWHPTEGYEVPPWYPEFLYQLGRLNQYYSIAEADEFKNTSELNMERKPFEIGNMSFQLGGGSIKGEDEYLQRYESWKLLKYTKSGLIAEILRSHVNIWECVDLLKGIVKDSKTNNIESVEYGIVFNKDEDWVKFIGRSYAENNSLQVSYQIGKEIILRYFEEYCLLIEEWIPEVKLVTDDETGIVAYDELLDLLKSA